MMGERIIFPPPLAEEGREGACGGNARAFVEALPPPAALRAAFSPASGRGKR